MSQDEIFLTGEGDNWFSRNRHALSDAQGPDWPLELIQRLGHRERFRKILELGCANGWRLAKLKSLIPGAECTGVDASREAIDDGNARFPGIRLHQGLLADVPLREEFDLVIVNFVLHWVDRRSLLQTFSEIDRLVAEKGVLVLGDFLPDAPSKRRYHHRLDAEIYTYKQDYPKAFEATGLYRELARVTFSHDDPRLVIQSSSSSERGGCVLLEKSLQSYYGEAR